MSEKPSLSEKNPYWIPKERYYELKHFCRQYDQFHLDLAEICVLAKKDPFFDISKKGDHSDPTWEYVSKVSDIRKRIFIIDLSANEACAAEGMPFCYKWLLEGVVYGLSYDELCARDAPALCSRDAYYRMYRRFFYILDKKRK